MAARQQKVFQLDEYIANGKIAIKTYCTKVRPGQNTGSGGKRDVLNGLRSEAMGMLAKGYKPKQVAEALNYDNFKILPKTITQMFCSPVPKPTKRIARQMQRTIETTKASDPDEMVAERSKHNAPVEPVTSAPKEKSSLEHRVKKADADTPDL